MKNNKIVPGVTLMLFGLVFLLSNFDVIDIHWRNFWHLWPVFIVIAGVNLIFANNRSSLATGVKLAVVVAAFGLIIFGDFGDRNDRSNDQDFTLNFDIDDDDDHGDLKLQANKNFTEAYSDTIKVARLNISGGATVYRINDTTSQLLSVDTKTFGNGFNNYFTRTNTDSLVTLNYKLKNVKNGKFKWNGKGNKSNNATFKLNPNPVWDIKVETGAAKVDFDLSKFKVKNLDVDGGAASFEVKLGQPLEVTTVDVSTGVSEVEIQVPATAAVRITKDTGLSSSNFDGFTKKDDNSYETAGFATAKNKMYIKLNGGVSEFKVKRY